MAQPIFFNNPLSSTLAEIAALTKAVLVDPALGDRKIKGLASLDEAGPMHLAFFDNLKYADQLAATKAGACLVSPRFEARVPPMSRAAGRAAVPRLRQPRARMARRRAAAPDFGSTVTASRRQPSSTRRPIWKTV